MTLRQLTGDAMIVSGGGVREQSGGGVPTNARTCDRAWSRKAPIRAPGGGEDRTRGPQEGSTVS
jgi:hypothetical protein